MPNGTLIQWGITTNKASWNTFIAKFPIPFKECHSAIGIHDHGGYTATSFSNEEAKINSQWSNNSSTHSTQASFIAFGTY